MDGLTAWVAHPPSTQGLDHLGTQAPCISLYGRLLPGITNVTDRARYYSLYPWFIWKFDQRFKTASRKDFETFYRRADCLLTLVAERHARCMNEPAAQHGAAMIGRLTLLPALDRLVPIPPSLFGQQSEQQIGALKYKQQFRIELFADEATAKEVEQQRKRVTELVQLFSFSFGTGKYWVPSIARVALNAAIDMAGKSSQSTLSAAYGDDLGKFLERRRPAIKQDLENIYKRFYPNTAMPSESVDKVIELLRARVETATKEGLAPKITSTTLSFRYSTDRREDPWNDAVFLLTKIALRSRELFTDRFKPRELKIANIAVPEFLKAMNVMDDALIAMALDKGWESPWVLERAREEMEALEAYGTSDDSGELRCQWLIDLIKGRKQRN